MSRALRKQFPAGGGPWLAIPGVGGIFDSGTTVPSNGALGFAPGCLFVDNDAAAGLQLWINEGSATSAAFKAVASTASGTFAALTVTALTATNAAISNAAMTNASLTTLLTMAANSNVAFNTTNGSMFGTAANQKAGFWGATPVVQPTGINELLGLNGNAATAANATNMNSNGNLGTRYFTFNDVVKDLKTIGLLATS